MQKLNKFLYYLLIGIGIVFFPCLFIVIKGILSKGFDFIDLKNTLFLTLSYIIIYLLISFLILKKNKGKFNKIYLSFLILLLFNFLLRYFNMNIKSGDYNFHLSNWVETYRSLSLKECFSSKVGNYSPTYNYFLILFSRIPLSDLYLIKLLSFIFELLTAYFIVDLVSYIRKKDFNILLFIIVLFIPCFFINSCEWGQCESIHTFFSFMAIYFAIKNMSKMSFMFLGLSLCFKFQSIILFPVALVLLLCKDSEGNKILKWKDLWIAPLTYVFVIGISMIFGKSFNDAFLIYLEQSVTYNNLSSGAPNLPWLFNYFNDFSTIKIILMVIFIVMTITVLIYLLVKFIRKKQLTNFDIINLSFLVTFFVVLIMPKMLDRYFYLSNLFAVVLICIIKNRIYFKILLITLISSSIVHIGYTAYDGVLSDMTLIAYSMYIATFWAALCNCVCGCIVLFLNNKMEEQI